MIIDNITLGIYYLPSLDMSVNIIFQIKSFSFVLKGKISFVSSLSQSFTGLGGKTGIISRL
jgi:hypothetical protein